MNTNPVSSHVRAVLSFSIRAAVLMIAVVIVLMAVSPVAAAGGESEPNDTFAKADRIVLNKVTEGYLDVHDYEYDDVDFYWFQGKKGNTVEAFVDGSASGVEPQVCLYDSSFALLACGTNVMDETDVLTFVMPEKGKYYVKVESTGCGEGGIACVGEYSLRVLSTTTESEPNDTFLRADQVGLPGGIAGAIDDHGAVAFYDDVDYYRFNGKAGTNVTIRVHSDNFTDLDPDICLYNHKKLLLDCQFEYGDDAIDFTLPSTGNYFVRVYASCTEGGLFCQGDYLLWLTR